MDTISPITSPITSPTTTPADAETVVETSGGGGSKEDVDNAAVIEVVEVVESPGSNGPSSTIEWDFADKYSTEMDVGIERNGSGERKVFSKKLGCYLYGVDVAVAIMHNYYGYLNDPNYELPMYLIIGLCPLNYIRPSIYDKDPKSLSQNAQLCSTLDRNHPANQLRHNLNIQVALLVEDELNQLFCDEEWYELMYQKKYNDPMEDSLFLAKLGYDGKDYRNDACSICLDEKKGLACGCGHTQTVMFQPCGHSICLFPCFKKLMETYNVTVNTKEDAVGIHGFPCMLCRTTVNRTFIKENRTINKSVLRYLRITTDYIVERSREK